MLRRVKFDEKEHIAVFPQALSEAVRHIESTESFDLVTCDNIRLIPEKFAINCDVLHIVDTPHNNLDVFFEAYVYEFKIRHKPVWTTPLYKEDVCD